MIENFDDFCLWVYVLVDDMWQEMRPLFKRPGPQAACSDSEILTMALVGECRGWSIETNLLSYWREHPDLFPVIPSQSRFNRRRRNLMNAFNLIRQAILRVLDLASDQQCVIDSLPIPVVKFHLVPGSTGDWDVHGANFGKISSKKQTVFGYKLHLLVTLKGIILDFILAPASVYDLTLAPGDSFRSSAGVFVEDQIALGPRLTVSLGAREDKFDSFGAQFSPRASAVFRPTASQTFRAAFSSQVAPAY